MINDENQNGFTMLNAKWEQIGFQGKNPRTDFRGGGHLGLLCLLYSVDNYPEEFHKLVAVTRDEEVMWLTAISSINLTHILIIYFFMNDGDVSPQYTKLLAGRNQFKNFCKLNMMDKRTFFEINNFGLRHLFRTWMALVAKNPNNIAMIMGSFNACLDKTKLCIHEILAREDISSIHHLCRIFEEKIQSMDQPQQ
jgi:hypothetical protein